MLRNRLLSLFLVLTLVVSVFGLQTRNVSADDSGIDDFVKRCYSVTFGREPDEEGFDYWKGRIVNGELDGSATVFFFVFSNEYTALNKSDKDFVKDLYTMFMGREPDNDGYDYWCSQIKGGMTRVNVFAGFANSEEFSKICEGYGITAGYFTDAYPVKTVNDVNLFVERLYKTCLGRIGDQGGQAYWTAGLLAGQLNGVGCAANFILSQEYLSKNLSNEEYIKSLYNAFMGREADQGGLEYWLGLMDQGMSKEQVFAGFANSPEFQGICAKYGIPSGVYECEPFVPGEPGNDPTATPKPTNAAQPTTVAPTAGPTETAGTPTPTPTTAPVKKEAMEKDFYGIITRYAEDIGAAENLVFTDGAIAVSDLNDNGNDELIVMRGIRQKGHVQKVDMFVYSYVSGILREVDITTSGSVAGSASALDVIDLDGGMFLIATRFGDEDVFYTYSCYRLYTDPTTYTLKAEIIDSFEKATSVYDGGNGEGAKYTHNGTKITEDDFNRLLNSYYGESPRYVFTDGYLHDKVKSEQLAQPYAYYEPLWRPSNLKFCNYGTCQDPSKSNVCTINSDGTFSYTTKQFTRYGDIFSTIEGTVTAEEWVAPNKCELTIGTCSYKYEDKSKVGSNTVNNSLISGVEKGAKIVITYPNTQRYGSDLPTSVWSDTTDGFIYCVKINGHYMFR